MNVTVLITGSEKYEEEHQLAVANVSHIPNVAENGLEPKHVATLLEQLGEHLERLDLGQDALHRLDLHFFVDGVPALLQSWRPECMGVLASAPWVMYKERQLWLAYDVKVQLKQVTL